jgi:hypothetical protein
MVLMKLMGDDILLTDPPSGGIILLATNVWRAFSQHNHNPKQHHNDFAEHEIVLLCNLFYDSIYIDKLIISRSHKESGS